MENKIQNNLNRSFEGGRYNYQQQDDSDDELNGRSITAEIDYQNPKIA